MQNSSQPHNVIMENRRELRISGVKDIDSFSETKIVLNTIMGELVVRGRDLHVRALEAETGDLSMFGDIKSLATTASAAPKTCSESFSGERYGIFDSGLLHDRVRRRADFCSRI